MSVMKSLIAIGLVALAALMLLADYLERPPVPEIGRVCSVEVSNLPSYSQNNIPFGSTASVVLTAR